MTGKSQSEAVAIIRNVPTGSKVKLVVSRQEDVPVNSGLPRVMVSSSRIPSYTSVKVQFFCVQTGTRVPSAFCEFKTFSLPNQGIEEADEKEELMIHSNGHQETPPNIPPLPQSHLLQNRSHENLIGSVAKIVSQFQEAANINHNVILFPYFISVCGLCFYPCSLSHDCSFPD